MNKKELAGFLAARNGISNKKAVKYVNDIFELIAIELSSGTACKISEFGTFATVDVAERVSTNFGLNPITVPAHRRIQFLPSSVLKKAVR